MNNSPQSLRSSRRQARALSAAGLLLLSSAAVFAQGTPPSGTGATQADRDLEEARRAAAANATATERTDSSDSSAPLNMNGGAGVGSAGTGAAGTGASGTGIGRARPRDDATDAVERGRARNLPGAVPGDAPAQRAGGAAVTDLPPAVTDLDPAVGGAAGSRPGAGLGGLPSDGVAGGSEARGHTNATAEARRDTRTTARMIGETSFSYRDRAMKMAEQELSEGSALSSSILTGSGNLSGAARTRVNDSVARANEARTEFQKAISRARSSNESRWENSRSEVVDRYEDYVKALEEARTAATEGGVRLQDAAGTSSTMPAPR